MSGGEVNSSLTNERIGDGFIRIDEIFASGPNLLIFSTGSLTFYSNRKGKCVSGGNEVSKSLCRAICTGILYMRARNMMSLKLSAWHSKQN